MCMCIYTYIYIYIHIHTYTHICAHGWTSDWPRPWRGCRGRPRGAVSLCHDCSRPDIMYYIMSWLFISLDVHLSWLSWASSRNCFCFDCCYHVVYHYHYHHYDDCHYVYYQLFSCLVYECIIVTLLFQCIMISSIKYVCIYIYTYIYTYIYIYTHIVYHT